MSRFSVREEEQRANRERKISRESRHSVRIQGDSSLIPEKKKSRFSETNDQVSSQPPKPIRASKNSSSSTSRTPKNSRSSHGSSRKKAVETVKINPVRIELYHEVNLFSQPFLKIKFSVGQHKTTPERHLRLENCPF